MTTTVDAGPRALDSAWCRVRHFWRALRPRMTDADHDLVKAWLTPAQARLFLTMEVRDQEHSAGTARELLTAGFDDPDLIVAGLLHDAGKGRQALWHRVVYVLSDAVSPSMAAKLASESGSEWRRALWRSRSHAEESARLALEAGTSLRCAELILCHHVGGGDPVLQALVRADEVG
jgi:hypothetical protein